MTSKTISVIMPAYMEAANIRAAVENTTWALCESGVEDYEILIVDCLRRDGTHDGTPEIADSIVRDDHHVRVFHNQYMNLGAKYWLGVDHARFPYVVLVPGDNELERTSLVGILKHLGEADIITTYALNPQVRPMMRRIISRTFTFLVNLSTGLHLRYYNGACLHRTEMVKQVTDRNESFSYMAVILVHLIKAGASVKEIPFTLQERAGGKSAAFKKDNVISVSKTIFDLFWQYRIARDRRV